MNSHSKHAAALIRLALVVVVGLTMAGGTGAFPAFLIGQVEAQTGSPDPRIDYIQLNGSSANSVTIAYPQSVDIKVQATNVGTGIGDRGAIYMSFPELDSYDDADHVGLLSSSQDLVYREYRPGDSSDRIWYACGSGGLSAARALLVKGQELSTPWESGESNSLEVTVRPPGPGTYHVYVKAVMRDGTEGSYYFDPTSGEYTDQQCEYVYQRTIEVESSEYAAYLPLLLKGVSFEPVHSVHGVRMQASSCRSASACARKLDCLQSAGVNVVYYAVYYQIAYYHSAFLPHRSFDSLAYLVPEAHARGMKVYPLITAALIGWPEHPQWNARLNHRGVTYDWLDFSIPEARNFVADVAAELVTEYQVDGILLDYIRWTTTDFAAADLDADDITKTVAGVYGRVKAISPATPVAASVFMSSNDGRVAGQMWYDWLDAGIIDYVTPMAYVGDRSLRTLLADWGASEHWPGRIIPRLSTAWFNPFRVKSAAEVLRQIDMCYDAGATGISLWDDQHICRDPALVEGLGAEGW